MKKNNKTEFLKNSGDPHLDAKMRLSMSFRDIVLQALYAFQQNSKEYKHIKEYFNQGGGATWDDIIKAVEDDNDIGKGYVELFRQLTEAELKARGVYTEQVEKKIIWK